MLLFSDFGEFPGKRFRAGMSNVHMLFQFLLRNEADCESGTSRLSTAMWSFVPVGVTITEICARKAFVEVETGVLWTFVPIEAIVPPHFLDRLCIGTCRVYELLNVGANSADDITKDTQCSNGVVLGSQSLCFCEKKGQMIDGPIIA